MRSRMRVGPRVIEILLGLALAVGSVPALATSASAGVAAAPSSQSASPADDAGGLSEADARAKAAKTGEPVEVAALRGEASEVFAMPDGNLEAREYLRPVWARVAGGWQRIDSDLVVTGSGMVAPKVSTMGVEFSGGGAAPLVVMRRAGRELSLSWPTSLPEPELAGAVATYPSVLPDVDLRMTAQADGFTQLLVVKTAAAAASPELAELRLRLSAQGLSVEETPEGGLQALDPGAQGAVFEAPKPMMWDSSPGTESAGTARSSSAGSGSNAEPRAAADAGEGPGAGESGKLAPVEVEVSAGQKEVVLTPDAGVLKGEDTTYPVYIDPQWYSPRASAWTMASEYWASSPQWKFNGESDAGMGFCNWSYCKPNDTKRLFYRVPVSAFAGRSILSAEFVVRNTWSASCGARTVELWQTKDISSSTTWNTQKASGFWIKQLDAPSFAYGFEGCAAKDGEFDVKSAVQTAANNKDSTMTFGLKAASEEDAYAWKRFSDKAFLRVKYNRPPAQIKMSQLTMVYGGTCKKPSSAARVRSLGLIYANNVTDPDGDSVAVQFQAKWDGGSWSPARTSLKASGTSFKISLPSTIPEGKSVNWYARAYDGAQYSPWSYAGDATACYFVYDKNAPAAPTVSSGEYPESDPADPDDPWHDGVGQYGSFTIDGVNSDVTTYWYGVNGDPNPDNTIRTSGGAAQIAKVLPSKPGVNFFTAKAFDSAGNGSETRTYFYRVKAGQPDRATWQMDEAADASKAAGSTPPRNLKLLGGTTAGVEGVTGTAVRFNGTDGYADTDLSPVNSTQSFTVSSWVKFDQQPTRSAVVATQPGNVMAGFELYYSLTYGWVFNQHSADSADATSVMAKAATPAPVTVGKWTQVAGSYDATLDLLRLYVDGQLVGEKSWSTPWNARRGLRLGAGSYSGTPGNFLPGAIDEVQIFSRSLADSEVGKLYAKETVGDPGPPAIAVFHLDEEAGATEIAGYGGVFPAEYHGAVTTGVPGMAGKATHFDGATGYGKIGQTSAPHINTFRSFTVSAWAKLDSLAAESGVVVTQAGKERPGMELYYSASAQQWTFAQYTADTPDAGIVRAVPSAGTKARAGEWTHLVGVHDTEDNTLTLYVNGVKAGSVTQTSPFYAAESMYIGTGMFGGATQYFFPGSVDDVRVLDRPVSSVEVQQMFKQRPLVKSRWKFEETVGTAPVTVPDAAGTGNSLTLNGGAKKSDAGFIDFGAMELDGINGYASAKSMPVDTSGSFTLTAWAQAAAMPDGAVALAGAEGSARSAFTVRFVPDATAPENLPGRWQLAVADKDAADATVVQVDNSAFHNAREWNHLALVYDGFAKEARLYVNGSLAEVACTDADGDGTSDSDTCTDQVPWAENVLSFKATSLQIGRSGTGSSAGGYFPGLVDDVWTFQGALTDAQIAKLATNWFEVPTEVPGD
ncbi:LamG-like jellyroll fold domain-containing protein [Streptomyces sp. NPDC002514]|uniref:LamG-like jellyroll fold domain-containing protein n=1 Tax=Streptomyces sp. NPDC001270 TaxID=3364554 RepID=UPI0036A279A6